MAVRFGFKNALIFNKWISSKREVMRGLKVKLAKFKKTWESKGKDPIEIVKLFMNAVLAHEKDQKNGGYMVSYLIPKEDCVRDNESPSGLMPNPRGVKYFLDQMGKKPNIVRSYCGGTPKNGYKIDASNISLNIKEKEISGNEAKIVIQSSGKDFPTPLTLKKDDRGYWRISGGISSLATGVKKSTG